MSDFSPLQQAADTNAPAAQPTAGQLLRQYREAAGVHLPALEGVLKVPVFKLQALEADQYDAFPDAAFLRALASSMCRALQVDAAPVLALLPHNHLAPLTAGEGINASFKDRHERASQAALGHSPKNRIIGIAVALLLLAALVVVLLPSSVLERIGQLTGRGGTDAAQAVTPAQPADMPAAPAEPPAEDRLPEESGPEEPAAALTSAQSDGQPPETAAQATLPALDAVPVAAQTPTLQTVPDAAQAVSTSPDAVMDTAQNGAIDSVPAGALVLRTRASSWVQVRDASGAVVLERIMGAGDSAQVPGDAPWKVIVGRADATEVLVRGKPLDLAALARDNVARFEVN